MAWQIRGQARVTQRCHVKVGGQELEAHGYIKRKMSALTPKINTTEKQPLGSIGIYTSGCNDCSPQTKQNKEAKTFLGQMHWGH